MGYAVFLYAVNECRVTKKFHTVRVYISRTVPFSTRRPGRREVEQVAPAPGRAWAEGAQPRGARELLERRGEGAAAASVLRRRAPPMRSHSASEVAMSRRQVLLLGLCRAKARKRRVVGPAGRSPRTRGKRAGRLAWWGGSGRRSARWPSAGERRATCAT